MESKPLDVNLNDNDTSWNLNEYALRHASTRHMMKMLAPNPNLHDDLRVIAEDIAYMGKGMVQRIADSPELTAGLRKLLEAKDCFVRAALDTVPESYTDR